jgi:hypothetical protein
MMQDINGAGLTVTPDGLDLEDNSRYGTPSDVSMSRNNAFMIRYLCSIRARAQSLLGQRADDGSAHSSLDRYLIQDHVATPHCPQALYTPAGRP